MLGILGASSDQKVLQKRLINDLIVWGPCLHARAPPVFESLRHKINDQLRNSSKKFHSVMKAIYVRTRNVFSSIVQCLPLCLCVKNTCITSDRVQDDILPNVN